MTDQTKPVQVTAEDIEAWSKVDRAIVDRARILCRKRCDPDCRACGAGRDAGWRRDAISAIKADAEAHRLAQSTPADAQGEGNGLCLPWTADPDDRPGYEWNWHVLDAKGDRVCFMAHGPDTEAKVRHLVAAANTLRSTAADPEPVGVEETRFNREAHDAGCG